MKMTAALLALATLTLTACGSGAHANQSSASPAVASASSANAVAELAPPTARQAAIGNGTLQNPDDQAVAFLYYGLSGHTPDLAKWASDDASSQTQNEFERKTLAKDLIDQYQSKIANAHHIGHMVLELRSEISAYDDKGGEFYVSIFNPVEFLEYRYKNDTIRIEFENGEAAQHWRLNLTDAAAVISANNSLHLLEVEALVDVVGTEPGNGGGTIKVRVTGYRLFTSGHTAKLGEVSLDHS